MNSNSWQVLASQCRYDFPDLTSIGDLEGDLICLGADLEPSTLIYAYAHGLFPMYVETGIKEPKSLGWFSPQKRGIFELNEFHVSKSTKRNAKKFNYRFNTDFEGVMKKCMDIERPHGWITQDFVSAYLRLNELGFAQSFEVYLDGELVGGVYGVTIGKFFAGESMFHTVRDASKVALMHLVDTLRQRQMLLFDTQWVTPHLASLGASTIMRSEYLRRLGHTLNI